MPAPDRAADDGGERWRRSDVDAARAASNDQLTQPADGRRDEDLAAATDVEHADAERERDAETGRDQRRREGERLGERLDPVDEAVALRSCRSTPWNSAT